MRSLLMLSLLFLFAGSLRAQCGVGELVSYDGNDFSNNMPPACEDISVIGSDMIFYGDDACVSGSWCGTNEFYHCDQDYSNDGNLDNEPYIEFTIQPSGIDSLNITGIDILMWSYMSGANSGAHEFRVAVSLDDGVSWIDSSDFSIALGSSCSGNDQGTMESWTLDDPIITVETVLFRIHLFGSNNSSNTLYQTVLYEATVLGEILLPSEETNFQLNVLPSSVELSWNVLDYVVKYELERAGLNGIFTLIQEFNQSFESQMVFADLSPEEFNLYRLKLTDGNGSISYSVVRRADLILAQAGETSFSIYPSIVGMGSYLTLSHTSTDESLEYIIYNAEAKPVLKGSLEPNRTVHAVKAPAIKGMYFLQLYNEKDQRAMRFVVQ